MDGSLGASLRWFLAVALASLVGCGGSGDGAPAAERSREVPSTPGWRRLPPAPIPGRDGHVAVWTGREMIVWGGAAVEVVPREDAGPSDGYSFDPATGTTVPIRETRFSDGAAFAPTRDSWRVIPPPPAAIGPHHALAVWTGTEMVLFGFVEHVRALAVAYSPESNDWRRLASPPSELDRTAPTAVWTGEEMIVWGGIDHSGPEVSARGAAYDPARNRWRVLQAAPVGTRQWHTAVWTGEEMIVWGGTDLVGIIGADEARDGAAYNPRTDEWRALPPSPIAGRHRHEAAWTGEEMIIFGGNTFPEIGAESGAYNPTTDSWRLLPSPPVQAFRHWTGAAWTGRSFQFWGGYNSESALSDGADYDPASDTWSQLPNPPLSARCRHSAIWTGEDMILWGGTAHCGSTGSRDADGAALHVPAPDPNE